MGELPLVEFMEWCHCIHYQNIKRWRKSMLDARCTLSLDEWSHIFLSCLCSAGVCIEGVICMLPTCNMLLIIPLTGLNKASV